MAVTEAALAFRIVIAFFVAMSIILATALVIGRRRKAEWFRKRQKVSFFNRRGFAGDALHFGYPRTWQGLLVGMAMFGAIALVGYWIIFGL